MRRPRHRASFWFVLLGTTGFLSIDPALFLVVLALALSALALTWIAMLVRMLLLDAFGAPRDSAAITGEASTRDPGGQ